MGLDIYIGVNNYEELYSTDLYDEENDYFNKHSLSRGFCNFMIRQDIVEHEAELDQIGKITGIDISALYEMKSYPEEDVIESYLGIIKSEEERQRFIAECEKNKEKVNGNIEKILFTINSLIEKLNHIDNLSKLLIETDFDTLNNAVYFSDFKVDKGQGYIDNNFGQDLRNFKRFLEYAKEKGTATVWFHFG